MKHYKNGDRCPCCGTVIEGKSDAWLQEFSELCDALRLIEWPVLPELFEYPALTEKK